MSGLRMAVLVSGGGTNLQSVIDEIADIRTWGCLSYSGEDEAIVMLENHSKLFYKALELGLFIDNL